MNKVNEFCNYIRQRSNEHKIAITRTTDLPGIMASIISDDDERKRLIGQTFDGNKWTIETANGKQRQINDRGMVELANRLRVTSSAMLKSLRAIRNIMMIDKKIL